jgi:hypothetical protein
MHMEVKWCCLIEAKWYSGLRSLKISFYNEINKKKIQNVFTRTMCYNFFSNLSKTYKLYYYFSFFIIIFLLNAKNILSNEFICLLWKHERDMQIQSNLY